MIEPIPSSPVRVVVTDVEMPFGSMVTFIFKWAVASIPAMILLGSLIFGLVMLATMALGILGAVAGS